MLNPPHKTLPSGFLALKHNIPALLVETLHAIDNTFSVGGLAGIELEDTIASESLVMVNSDRQL